MSSLVAFLGHARRSQAVSAMHAVCVYANIGGGGGAGQIFEGAFRDFLSTKKIDTRKPFSNPPSKTPPKNITPIFPTAFGLSIYLIGLGRLVSSQTHTIPLVYGQYDYQL